MGKGLGETRRTESNGGVPGTILSVAFNQDGTCFAAGTSRGFEVRDAASGRLRYARAFDGGIAVVAMLWCTNVLGLVGGGDRPAFAPTKVMMWDDHRNQCFAELHFRSAVRGVRMVREAIAVATDDRVYVYDFGTLQQLHRAETTHNPKGVLALAAGPRGLVVAHPSARACHVSVRVGGVPVLVRAHRNPVAHMALDPTGLRLATVSERGTVVRVWDTATGDLVAEMRRGKDRADVCCLAFSRDADWLCLSSDRDTVHVFHVPSCRSVATPSGADDDNYHRKPRASSSSCSFSSAASSSSSYLGGGLAADRDRSPSPGTDRSVARSTTEARPGPAVKAQRSRFGFMGGASFLGPSIGGYVSAPFSFAQIHNAPPHASCAFGARSNSVAVAGRDGSFRIYDYDPDVGGEATGHEERSSIRAAAAEDDLPKTPAHARA